MRLHLYPTTMAVAVAVLFGCCVGRHSKEASIAPVAQVGSEYNQHQDEIAAIEPWNASIFSCSACFVTCRLCR